MARDDQVFALLTSQPVGRLVTVSPECGPHLGVYPFLWNDGRITVLLTSENEQTADLRANARCLFEIDEPLSSIPTYWDDESDAPFPEVFFRSAVYEGTAAVKADEISVACTLRGILEKYQPEGRRPIVAPRSAVYGGIVRRLAAIEIDVARSRVRFNVGQQRSDDARRQIIARLGARGRPIDLLTAEAVSRTISPPDMPCNHARAPRNSSTLAPEDCRACSQPMSRIRATTIK